MDNQEQNKKFLYPNSDRGPEYNKDSLPDSKPVVHMTDVMSKPDSLNTQNSEHKISAIHTFKDDVSTETSKEGFSVTNILLANQKAKNQASQTEMPKKNNGAWKILTALFFGIVIIFVFSYIGYKTAKTPSQIQAIKNPSQKLAGNMLYAEESYLLNIKDKSRTEIYNEIIKNGQDSKMDNGKIKSIYLSYTEGTSSVEIKASDFLEIIAPGAPDIIKRNLKDNYVFGFYSYETNHPFIVLKSENYDSAFAGMLEWERGMYADLGETMYKKNVENKILNESVSKEVGVNPAGTTTVASVEKGTTTGAIKTSTSASVSVSASAPASTSSKTNLKNLTEYDIPFVDKVIKNNDTRVLYRPNGQIAFFYTFFNKDTIIITVSEQALSEIIYRLTSGQITR